MRTQIMPGGAALRPASPRPAPPAALPSPPAPAPLPALRPIPATRTGPTSTPAGAHAAAHPLAEALYWAAIEPLTLAAQIGLGFTPGGAAEMRQTLHTQFAVLDERARAAGVVPEDVRDALYPIMALFDELLVQLPWPGQAEWRAQPLQFVHFRENRAGETFFERAQALLRQPHRAHVLTIYSFCLALGFQGRYAMGGGAELTAFYEALGAFCGAVVPPSEVLAPRAERPAAERSFLRRQAPIVTTSLVLFGVAALLFLLLRFTLSVQAARVERPMDEYARSVGAGAP
ncbi:MAG TPA: DotU/TssL family secretion system protein [Polyangiaceae bacterium]|jgi:type VI secretion system protein ImpK